MSIPKWFAKNDPIMDYAIKYVKYKGLKENISSVKSNKNI